MIDRRSFLGGVFAASVLPATALAQEQNLLGQLREYDNGAPFQPDKPSLAILFMTAQQMYASCGALFGDTTMEIAQIKGADRNIEKVMVMPPLEHQLVPDEDRNLRSARAGGFTVLSADIETVLRVSEQLAGRPVFAYERGKITGHSQKAFFYNIKDARGFEFDPSASFMDNDLYRGLQDFGV